MNRPRKLMKSILLAKRVNEMNEAIRKILLRNVESIANMFYGIS